MEGIATSEGPVTPLMRPELCKTSDNVDAGKVVYWHPKYSSAFLPLHLREGPEVALSRQWLVQMSCPTLFLHRQAHKTPGFSCLSFHRCRHAGLATANISTLMALEA